MAPSDAALAELDTRLSDVQAGIAAGRAQLRQALLAGDSTRNHRRRLAELEAIHRDLAGQHAELVAQRDAEADERVAAAGDRLAAEVAGRISARMAVLQPPPMPTLVRAA